MFLSNPGILAAGAGGGAKTYAEFQAHIATLAVNGSRAWAGITNQTAGAFVTTATTEGGLMYGSSWNTFFYRPNASTCRVLRHGFPSQAAFEAQVSAGRDIFFRISNSTPDQPLFSPLSRNGYTSLLSNDGTYPAATCTELIRWDGERAWKSAPSIGSGETEYTW